MLSATLKQTYHRYKTVQTGRISALPVVVLMPHSACNCRCTMCDIWKANEHKKQLSRKDIEALLPALEQLGTKRIVLSGGEAMLHPDFFELCRLLKEAGMKISVLSTGLTMEKHAASLIEFTDDTIVSLDGNSVLHDRIRNIPGAFQKLFTGVQAVKKLDTNYRISSRTVIHKLNYRQWPAIIDAGIEMGLNQMSFLPADTSSLAFNREVPWDEKRQSEIMPAATDLDSLEEILYYIYGSYEAYFRNGFIAEAPEKLHKIHQHYSAMHGLGDFPYKKCNAPWVSTVIEPDGNVRPCFFHDVIGNIHSTPIEEIINSAAAIAFRKQLDIDSNLTCKRCVCYLNLKPGSLT